VSSSQDQTLVDYRKYLSDELARRIGVNPRYSLRAFARDLGMNPGRLSHVLRGHYGLSQNAAEVVAKKLNLGPQELKVFCDLVALKRSQSSARKVKSSHGLSKVSSHFNSLSLDSFMLISEWYHLAILEYFSIRGVVSDVLQLSKTLGVPPQLVEQAVDRLVRLKMLKKDKSGRKFKPLGSYFVDPKGVSSRAVQNFHKQIVELALRSLVIESPLEREFGTVLFSFDRARMGEAQADIAKFRFQFNKKFGSYKKGNLVFALSTQFFRVSGKEQSHESQ
jgi:uncharacterized protein (TIGR02147 family)